MAKIEVSYDENLNLGNYQTARVGLVIKSEKEVHNEVEIQELSSVLLEIAKKTVKEELNKIKNEKDE